MSALRNRLSYGNVMATIAVFLVLGGATAVAAGQLGKNSVGSKQLKKNSVAAAKIKKNAVTKAKIKNGAVSSAKIADAGVKGVDINAAGAPFSQIVARLRSSSQLPFTEGIYPVGSYTQNAGEVNQYIGWADVTFDPACAPPRAVTAYLLIDTNVASPSEQDVLGYGVAFDENGSSSSVRIEFGPYPSGMPMYKAAPAAATSRRLDLYLEDLDCDSGTGAVITGAGVDVIGSK